MVTCSQPWSKLAFAKTNVYFWQKENQQPYPKTIVQQEIRRNESWKNANGNKEAELTTELSSMFIPTYTVHSFSPATPTSRGYTQLPLRRWWLHIILHNRRGSRRQHNCLRFVLPIVHVDCARKNRHLWDLTVLLKYLSKKIARHTHHVPFASIFPSSSLDTIETSLLQMSPTLPFRAMTLTCSHSIMYNYVESS